MAVTGRKEKDRDMRIDFTNCKIEPTYLYSGSNGKKFGIIYENEIYMLKFPNQIEKKEEEYSNGVISEYISCHIFKSMGFDAQDTLLGTYKLENGQEKLVVACKDFTKGGFILKEFAELKNSVITTSNNGYGTDLEEVLESIEEQRLVDPKILLNYFWKMFIGDALLGNFDRHNGNWGFLINRQTNEIKFAPIYDCGSCLYPQADDDAMKEYLSDAVEMEKRVYIFPNSALRIEKEKVNYYDFIMGGTNEDCNKALLEVIPHIDLECIDKIIDGTPYISDIRKQFYKTIIRLRYEKILKPAYEKLVKN